MSDALTMTADYSTGPVFTELDDAACADLRTLRDRAVVLTNRYTEPTLSNPEGGQVTIFVLAGERYRATYEGIPNGGWCLERLTDVPAGGDRW